MMQILKRRFIRAIVPFDILLKTIGICLHLQSPFQFQKQFAFFSWSCICFIISFQAGLQIFIEIGLSNICHAFSPYNKGYPSRMDAFSKFVETTSSFLCGSLTYLVLTVTARKTMTQFCNSLDRIDYLAKRPNLASLRRLSMVAVIWILFTVTQIRR